MGDRLVTTVKQLCLGVAVAGVVTGAGSVFAAAVAYAEPTASDSQSTSDAGPADSASNAEAPSRKKTRSGAEKATGTTSDPRDSAAITRPRIKRPSNDETEATGVGPGTDSTRTPASATTKKSPRATELAGAISTGGSAFPRHAAEGKSTADDGVDDDTDTVAQTVAPPPSTAPAPAPVEVTTSEPAVKPATDLRVLTPRAPRSPQHLPLPVPFVPATPASAAGVSTTSGSSNRSRITTTADVSAQITDPTTQHVLVIGVDGVNLGKILDDPGNANFFALMNSGTTAASSIVGHTTISNPSWTTILTGVWDTKSGVINNIFTPQTYNNWPTVFNQLEAFNSNINTKAIADWQVIADIAGAGSIPADEIVFIPRGADDPGYVEADAAVTAETVKSILGNEAGYEDVPNFLFTYVTQVDEAGHQYGGASPEYAAALSRTDTNIGLILDAVAAREAATGEDWTVIMVTDHGHQPQLGFGHGFQSPDETTTFVIVDGPDYADGQMNLKYSISDITPTVVSLFGAPQSGDYDGVPLTSHGGSQVDPVDLHQALNDAIDMYGWPDIATNVALSVRTIFATVPYYVDIVFTGITSELQAVANQGIFLISDLAAVAIFPVQLVGDALYAFTDFIAQIVGRLTGAGVIPPSTSTLQLETRSDAYILV